MMHEDNQNCRALNGLAAVELMWQGMSLQSEESCFREEVCDSVDLGKGGDSICRTGGDIHYWQNNLRMARSCRCTHCCIESGDGLIERSGKHCYC